MSNRIPPARQPITLGQQLVQMKKDFPEFQYSQSNNLPTWEGTLQPMKASPKYTVRIVYRFAGRQSKSPKVWVILPKIHIYAPHLYNDGSLCLYFPRDRDWSPYKFISQTIVPWASLWLAFYEIWLETDHWYGPEAPHTNTKRDGN